LLAKLSPRFSKVGNIPLAFLAGVGAAIALGGAIMGTIVTQVGSSFGLINLASIQTPLKITFFRPFESALILVGTVTTLIYFQFSAKSRINQQPSRPKWLETFSFFGQIFIGVTLGALFAGVYLATLAAMVERLDFVRNVILQIFLLMSSVR
jgi:hypothetical protein